MKKGQTSVRGGVEDFLCLVTDMYITQGSNSAYSHKGIMANDIRGLQVGVKYPYYAPCTCKCIKTYPSSGQVMWQSINKVRFANGRIDYATFMTVHDDTVDAKIGQIVKQGEQLGNMGTKGNATGVHVHIEVSQSNDTTWTKNQYGNWHFNNEYDLDDCYFVDDTNILNGLGGSWKKTSDVPVNENTTGVEAVDQVLHSGSKAQFYGCQIEKINKANDTFYSSKFGIYLPLKDFTRVGGDGQPYANQVVSVGNWLMNYNTYQVKSVSKNPDKAVITLNGKDYSILSAGLLEV